MYRALGTLDGAEPTLEWRRTVESAPESESEAEAEAEAEAESIPDGADVGGAGLDVDNLDALTCEFLLWRFVDEFEAMQLRAYGDGDGDDPPT